MPTVSTIFGFRVVIYFNDHRPAHVHLLGKGREAVFALHCPDGPPQLQEGSLGFSSKEIRRIKGVLAWQLAELCAKWKAIHGYY